MRIQPSREDLVELTELNPFERFASGRPRVPDDLIERMKLVTTEEAWGVLRKHGYHRQFVGNWLETHPGTITVGRAVTAQFLPHRPDYHDAIQKAGLAEGRGSIGGQNSWVSYPRLKLVGLSLALPAPLASETYGLLTKTLDGEPPSDCTSKERYLQPFTRSRFPDRNRQD
ncbi:MAG: hypothetical protein ACJ8CR_24820 [Roseiflexaceae bacterium]